MGADGGAAAAAADDVQEPNQHKIHAAYIKYLKLLHPSTKHTIQSWDEKVWFARVRPAAFACLCEYH